MSLMTTPTRSLYDDLDQRSRDIFRRIVETYLETGEPVGSRTLATKTDIALSPASIRNTMADLTESGLLHATHASAGRVPTETGLRLFVDAMLEFGDIDEEERREIERSIVDRNETVETALDRASTLLSGLASGAGLVVAPRRDKVIKHIEFVSIGVGRTLVVLVDEDGQVENRVIDAPAGLTPSAIAEATNYLNARLRGRTLSEALRQAEAEIRERKARIDELAAKLIEAGLADWNPAAGTDGALIVRGRSKLLNGAAEREDLERIRQLFDELEAKRDIIALLEAAKSGEGVRIFIGSENKLFSLSGSSVIAAPYMDSRRRVVGVLGVIGPTRLNYARVVPLVDYTAKVLGRLIG